MAVQPLADVKVVALEQSVAGPLCTRILAELGADVVKVERAPRGDFARHWDENALGESAQFWWLNRGKQSILLDLSTDASRRSLDGLLEEADVLVYNMSPAAADRLGLTDSRFGERYPRLVVCQISGYGNEATAFRDRKAYDMLIQAEAGVMSLTGSPEQPSRVGVSLCDVATGLYAAILVLAALQARALSGKGTTLDVSMLDATSEFLGPMLISYLNAGIVYPRISDSHHAIAPYGAFVCRDGRTIVIAVEQDDEWGTFCASFLGNEELVEDPRFSTNHERVINRDAVNELVTDALAAMTFDEASRALDELGLAYASLNDISGLAEHPVLVARSMIKEVPTSEGANVRTLVGIAERSFPGEDDRRERPPFLDEDAATVLSPVAAVPTTSKAFE